MLIKDGNLDFKEFKKFFMKLEWKKVPRKLGPDHSQFFYVAKYEDEEKIIKVTIRPSNVMQLSESFKNRVINTGKAPPKGYKGALADFGTTVEVRVDQSVITKLEKIAKVREKNKNKVFSLD